MKKTFTLLLIALAGCVPSWNPFYTEKDLIFESSIVGVWQPLQRSAASEESWAFITTGENDYRLEQTDEEGRKAVFEAHLFTLANRRFLDLYLVKLEGETKLNAWAGFSLVPAHLLLKVEQIEPTLKLAAMDPEQVKRIVKEEQICHRVVSEGNIVLTATTKDLQDFVARHLKGEQIFGGAMELGRAPCR